MYWHHQAGACAHVFIRVYICVRCACIGICKCTCVRMCGHVHVRVCLYHQTDERHVVEAQDMSEAQ